MDPLNSKNAAAEARRDCAAEDGSREAAWLAAQGYAVLFRRDVWCECLVEGHAERWTGRGTTEALALEDALRTMFPSVAARDLLAARVAADGAVVVEAEPLVLDTADRGQRIEAAMEPSIEAAPPALEGPATVEGEPAHARDATQEAPAIDEAHAPRLAGPAAPPPGRRLGVADALEALELVEACLATEVDELGLCSPTRQRLVLSQWMARARAAEEALPGGVVYRRVRDLARELSGLCKMWWPGSIRALRADMRPVDAAAEADDYDGPAPRSWLEAAEVIEAQLDRREAAEEARGFDEYGWSDLAACQPAPAAADSLVAELRKALESGTGSLRIEPEASVGLAFLARTGAADSIELARRARWLRPWTTQFADWAAIAGRLRWLAHKAGDRAPGFAETLEADHRPPVPWAKLLGHDPDKREKQRRRGRLLKRLVEGPPLGGVDLARWLVDAFPVFDTARLGELLGPARAALAGLAPAMLEPLVADDERRNVRRRLASLKKALEAPAAAARASATTAREELAQLPPLDATEEPSGTDDPHRTLRETAARHAADRRAVLVSNRGDEHLRQRLLDDLRFQALDWSEGGPRRVQSIVAAVRAGSYDLVLVASGFQSHAVDGALAKACRASAVPLVRVNRARPLAVYRALLRELGRPPGPHLSAESVSTAR